MLEFILMPENLYFGIAMVIMFGIAVLEGITTLLGFALSGIIDSLVPEFDSEVDFLSAELEADGALSKFFSWLRVGKVPVIMLLVIFLTSFSLTGYGIQSFSLSVTGSLLSPLVASIPAVFISIPILRMTGRTIARYLPKDETDAVSVNSFIGRMATLTTADAITGRFVEAKLRDEHGNTHYIMLEPDGDFTIPAKSQALLISKVGHNFRAIIMDSNK